MLQHERVKFQQFGRVLVYPKIVQLSGSRFPYQIRLSSSFQYGSLKGCF